MFDFGGGITIYHFECFLHFLKGNNLRAETTST